MAVMLRMNETALIDSYRPQTDSVSPLVTQGDNPGVNPQHVGGVQLPELPPPAIGGVNASGDQNGFSTGFRSFAQRFAPFTGAMAKPPAITNPVQGEVGLNNRADRLHAGVMNQLVQYTPSQKEYVASYVGNVAVRDVIVSGR